MLVRNNVQRFPDTCILQTSAISADILSFSKCVTHACLWVAPQQARNSTHTSIHWQACLANASQVQVRGRVARGRGRQAHQNSSKGQAKPLLPWRLPFSVRRTWLMTLLLLQVWSPLCNQKRPNCCRLKDFSVKFSCSCGMQVL